MKAKRTDSRSGCARALLFVILTSIAMLAQSAFAIIGYVNVGFTNGYVFVANPLIADTNTLNYIMPGPSVPDNTKAYLWNPTNQAFSLPATYSAGSGLWVPDYEVPIGKGFVVHSPSIWTNTFVGEVFQGTFLNPIAGNHKLSLVASAVPATVNLSDGITEDWSRFPQMDGANAYVFRTELQSYSDAFTCFDSFGWHDPNGVVGTNGPVINVAQSFFVRNSGPDTNWVISFILVNSPPAALADVGPPPPTITRIRVQAGVVTLDIGPPDAPYNVEWSGDGVNWTTLAEGRIGKVWSGALPPGPQGYFRITQP